MNAVKQAPLSLLADGIVSNESAVVEIKSHYTIIDMASFEEARSKKKVHKLSPNTYKFSFTSPAFFKVNDPYFKARVT